ncbi:MAG: hypothetical protein EXR70_16650 [Deltaproteobacteria bacterium]|nr:hypothetical protein [Deltaproteobacteria bacterium]
MAAIRIIKPMVYRKPCVCGGTLNLSHPTTVKRTRDLWLCSNYCGARGVTYEGALRRKVRLDLLGWGDLKRKAQAMIEVEEPEEYEITLQ